jgi:magnesium chelatase family protein
VIVPLRQSGEAKLVEGIEVLGIASIIQLVAFLRGVPMPPVDPIEVVGERAGNHASHRLDRQMSSVRSRPSGPAK